MSPSDIWTCTHCGFKNMPREPVCKVCSTMRIGVDDEEEKETPLPPAVFEPVWPAPPKPLMMRVVSSREIYEKGSLRASDYLPPEPRLSWWKHYGSVVEQWLLWLLLACAFIVGWVGYATCYSK